MMDENEQPADPADSSATASPWLRHKRLVTRIAAAAAVAALIGTTGYVIGHVEVSRLQKTVHQLETEKAAALKQYEDLRVSYSQTISMQRCEVIDGLDDCLAAGLKRPPRFAESDRQLLEARRALELQRLAEEAARAPKPEVPVPVAAAPELKAESKPEAKAETKAEGMPEARPSAPKKKLSMSEFLEEIKKIPGVGIEPGQQERPGGDKKDKARR